MRWMGLLLLAGAGAGGWAYFTVLEAEPPAISTRTQRAFVGPEYVHALEVSDAGRGVQRVSVLLRTSERDYPLEEQTYEGSLLKGAVLREPRRIDVRIRPGELKIPEGRATLVVEAQDFSLRGNRASAEVPLLIDTQPPRVSVQTGLTYVYQGGAELAVYTIEEEVEQHGVTVGERFFPGFPHPTERGAFVAFYGLPWDRESASSVTPTVVATDRAGNRTGVGLTTSLRTRPERFDKIELSENFMRSKVAELRGGESPADLLPAYLELNRGLRDENAKQIRKICENSSTERLWSQAFMQMTNSKVGAQFAEQRSYMFNGEEVDHQVHLGYDLSSTSRAPVPAANDGVVAFSGPLGIYGNTVIMDHGLGLFSLYGHLSEITVQQGQALARGETMGRTGTTGLAGGDHLHYGILLSGEFVNPNEWFDPKWIAEHLEVKLQPPEPDSNSEMPGAESAAAAPAKNSR
jgi:murein DD-endopeptidase MepM/ murein hydrolase activator NlpD